MSEREVIKVIGDILKNQMNLDDSQIMLSYEKYDIPENDKLFIDLSYVSGRAIANNSVFDPETNIETIYTTMNEIVQIDLMSFGPEARTRKEEVISSLGSVFSQQQQEKYNMQIARIPGDFINASSLEETKFLNRFTINITVTSLSSLTKAPDYFTEFDRPEVKANV
jgi:hypothetical protein